MNISDIAQIAANILYLDEDEQIVASGSLFQDYNMSWLDFVDFACELQAAANLEFTPDQLWPINAMMGQAAFYRGGAWTDAGHAELARLFDGYAAPVPSGSAQELQNLFSVAWVAHRLRVLREGARTPEPLA